MSEIDPEKHREFALEVVRQLRARDFEALWAGGCVRDQLLGRPIQDYDVATSATPAQIRQVFGPHRTVAIGAAFGVIVVLGPRGTGLQVEAATFRLDDSYSDGRRPDTVTFSTPQADAQRRDFTINGLFFDPLAAEVIDYVDGRRDLNDRIVRAIGDPHERFSEDKLRLLRAVRFAATLDFTLERVTREAVQAMAALVTVVSAERIADEMRRMLVHPRRGTAMAMLADVGLLDVILPELAGVSRASDPATETAWRETIEILSRLADASFELALAGLLHRFANVAQIEHIGRRWKLSNRERQRICWLVEHLTALQGARQLPWSRLQRTLVHEGSNELLALVEAIGHDDPRTHDDVKYCRDRLEAQRYELDPPPLLTGDDLVAHGVPRGKVYQRLLTAVRDAQLDGLIHTRDEALALVDRLRQSP